MATLSTSISEMLPSSGPLRRAMLVWWLKRGTWLLALMLFLADLFLLVIYLGSRPSSSPDLQMFAEYSGFGYLILPITIIMPIAVILATIHEFRWLNRFGKELGIPGPVFNPVVAFRSSILHLSVVGGLFLAILSGCCLLLVIGAGQLPYSSMQQRNFFLSDFLMQGIHGLYIALLFSVLAIWLICQQGRARHLLVLAWPAYILYLPMFEMPFASRSWCGNTYVSPESQLSNFVLSIATPVLSISGLLLLARPAGVKAMWNRIRSAPLTIAKAFSVFLTTLFVFLAILWAAFDGSSFYVFQKIRHFHALHSPADVSLSTFGMENVYEPSIILIWGSFQERWMGWLAVPFAILVNTSFVALVWRVCHRTLILGREKLEQ